MQALSAHGASAAAAASHRQASRHLVARRQQQPARCRSRRCCAAAVLVKVCGVTTAEDAAYAVQQGADLIGMIMWPKAKRAVSDAAAAAIAAAARAGGAQAVGVFVDEDAATIARRCRQAGISIAQLHGDASRAALADIPPDLQVVYVLQADDDGHIVTQLPAGRQGATQQRPVDWLLVDGMTGGSGKTFDWTKLQVPTNLAQRGWLLAGGLNPGNVAQAVSVAAPSVVDVSSGVCGPDGLAKDRAKVAAFIAAAKQQQQQQQQQQAA